MDMMAIYVTQQVQTYSWQSRGLARESHTNNACMCSMSNAGVATQMQITQSIICPQSADSTWRHRKLVILEASRHPDMVVINDTDMNGDLHTYKVQHNK